jgi:hypothetical protein
MSGISKYLSDPKNQNMVIILMTFPLLLIPSLQPIGLPIETTKMTQDVWDVFTNLPEDSVIFMYTYTIMAQWYNQAPGEIVVWNIGFDLIRTKNCKIVMVGAGATNQLMSEIYFERGYIDSTSPKANGDPVVYGEDWVFVGYQPGATLYNAMTDFLKVNTVDKYGTQLLTYPMIQEMVATDGKIDVNDWGLVYFNVWGNVELLVRYILPWTFPAGVPVIGQCMSGAVSFAAPYVETGQISGMINGQRGGAELELLSGFGGLGLAQMDGQTITHLYAFGLLVLGLVVGGYTKLVRRED